MSEEQAPYSAGQDGEDRITKVRRLIDEARGIVAAIRDAHEHDKPTKRTVRDAHQLRQTLAGALIISERLARSLGNVKLVQLEQLDGKKGEVYFTVDLITDWEISDQ